MKSEKADGKIRFKQHRGSERYIWDIERAALHCAKSIAGIALITIMNWVCRYTYIVCIFRPKFSSKRVLYIIRV